MFVGQCFMTLLMTAINIYNILEGIVKLLSS